MTGEGAHGPPGWPDWRLRDRYRVLRRQVNEELSRDPLPSCSNTPGWAQRQGLQHIGRRCDLCRGLPPLAQRSSSGNEGPAGTRHHAQ
jgi:hypothetical protein